ncbi:hypothetical protein CLOM_g12223 [Closterium sp. NIES-68]|nr:hypothetical protein CLOM_g12223 [Closterium sp. NIES-68]GJP70376.1 hypothetical protein CLOP_g1324 [Closterium sp. NIES-67]
MAAPDFADLEAVDGVRLTWNVWPNSKVEATKCVVPFAALYTPVKRLPDMPVLPYEPIRCKSCVAVLNPFARVDFIGKMWVCPFCYQRNQFPPHYAAISEQNLPAELFPQYTTIEYSLPLAAPAHPPVFLFLLDTCLIEEELGYLKTAVSQVLDELGRDAFPVAADKRPARCTGTALTVAVGLLGACVPNTGARILSFVGGPCTEGPGVIVSRELSDPIRSHKDLDKDAAPHYNKAAKFYEGLAKQLVAQGHVLDLFASALDQVGIAEMKVAVERTGGLVALSESYGHTVFKDSLKRVFQQGDASLGLSFNGLLELHCSKDIKVQGAIGPCASLEKKGPSTSDTAISQGHTTQWKLCGLDALTTVAVLFDIATAQQPSGAPSAAASAASQQLHLQFTTSYQHPSGETRLRCTTITRSWVDGSIATADLVAGFDQEAAAVVVARLMSHKMEAEEEYDATRWLDRMLIRVCNKFGDYRKDDPASFSLSPNFSIFPQFLFNLRRSQFVQVFGSSPDETAYFRMALNRENVLNCLVMIQPTLTSYSFNAPPEPALLDVAAIAVDRILLLDAFFSVVIFHGSTIAQWRNAGYHNQPEHQAFAQLLAAPQADATAIMAERFPTPRLVDCDQNGSQARFLLAKLNPSATYNSASTVPGGEVILTDDVSLQVFMEHLQRLAVQS